MERRRLGLGRGGGGGGYIGLGEESRKEGEGELWEGDHGRENRKERERWRWRQKEKEGVEIGKREIRKGREYSRGEGVHAWKLHACMHGGWAEPLWLGLAVLFFFKTN